MRSEVEQHRAPGEAAADPFEQHGVARLDLAAAHRFVECQRNRRGRRVAVLVDRDDQLLEWQLEPLRRALQDADVGLVRDQPVDVLEAEAGGGPLGGFGGRPTPPSLPRVSGPPTMVGRWSLLPPVEGDPTIRAYAAAEQELTSCAYEAEGKDWNAIAAFAYTHRGKTYYDAEDFVSELRSLNVAPHVATKIKGSAIDGRTTRHAGYKISQVIRKRIEEAFGWAKAAAGLRKTRHRGLDRVGWQFTFTLAAYNLIRLPKLLAGAAS